MFNNAIASRCGGTHCVLSTGKVEAGGPSQARGQSELLIEILSKNLFKTLSQILCGNRY